MTDDLLARYPIISDQINKTELKVILNSLQETLRQNVEGEVLEMGCYLGTTSLFITRLLLNNGSNKKFHVYDSFSGLPEKTIQDSSPAGEQFVTGELLATKKQFIENYKKASLPLPRVHKCWFKDLDQSNIPEKVAFAFLDGDYYESIKQCLNLIAPNLTKGSIVVVDDYQNEALPGAKKAVDQWLSNKNYKLKVISSLAIIEVTRL